LEKKGSACEDPTPLPGMDLIMNKNIFLVLAIIFMVIVVTGTGGWLTSSA